MSEAVKTPVVPVEYNYTLTLSEEEARTLQTILKCVGGSTKGRRKHVDDIARALRQAGLEVSWGESYAMLDRESDYGFKYIWLK